MWEWLGTLRAPFRGASVSASPTSVEQVIGDLKTLNGRTERDFLRTGEKLVEFRSSIRNICDEMSALTALIGGDQGQAAAQSLDRILALSSGLRTQIESGSEILGVIRGHSARVRGAFGSLRNTVSLFRSLCTLTRIETSRLGNNGAEFSDLASEARPLSESIQACGEGVLDAVSRLDAEVQTAMATASDLWNRQLKDLPVLVDGVTACLTAFEERRESARRAAVQQAE